MPLCLFSDKLVVVIKIEETFIHSKCLYKSEIEEANNTFLGIAANKMYCFAPEKKLIGWVSLQCVVNVVLIPMRS